MESNPDQLKSLGVFGVYKESFKIVASWKKIFIQIALVLIFPFSILTLHENQISNSIDTKISNRNTPGLIQTGSSLYRDSGIPSQVVIFWIIRLIFIKLLLMFSLFSTSAVIYTVASIYTHKEISFKKVMKVVPKIWKRSTVTSLWYFYAVVIYTLIAVGFILLLAFIIGPRGKISNQKTLHLVLNVILVFLYVIGLIYMIIVWILACVISILGKNYGLKALKSSKNLIKGKIWVCSAIFVPLQTCLFGLVVVFEEVVVDEGESVKLVGKVFLGIFCYLLHGVLVLVLLVTQTVLYFVCKSYHHESIDSSALAEHLELSYESMGGDKDDQLGENETEIPTV